jgi:hypothetical protein
VKLLEENSGEMHPYIRVGKEFLDGTPKAQEKKGQKPTNGITSN